MINSWTTVAGYLLARLKEIGADHIFGVPGDYSLGFLNQVLKSDVEYIGTCNELNAAYAADGYARIRGIGALCTTYGVGELSALNGVAGAFAERVPVVVITGAPAAIHFQKQPLLHHTLGDFGIPQRMYEKITVADTLLVSGASAPGEIDRVLSACLTQQRPVYISIPSDVVMMKCEPPKPFRFPDYISGNQDGFHAALIEAAGMLEKAGKPVVLGGMELIRYNLQKEFAGFLENTGFPYATMMLGKTVLSEHHPQFIGMYEGEWCCDDVRKRVETSDCILQLGGLMTDVNTGGFTAHLDDSKTITATMSTVKIGDQIYPDVTLNDFISGLTEKFSRHNPGTLDIRTAALGCLHRRTEPYQPVKEDNLTIRRFFDRMSHFLEDDAIVVAETGVSLFSAAEMLMPEGATFIGQAFYGSIGYSVGATLGACIAAPHRPVVLFVGDGSFQVTAQELSTLVRNHLKPVIFLINNDGYTIERVISDHSYNDIQPWHYHKLIEVFGEGKGMEVFTEGALEDALVKASASDDLVFIEIHTGRLDCPESLRSSGKAAARNNHLD